jgi:hypothetical protein
VRWAVQIADSLFDNIMRERLLVYRSLRTSNLLIWFSVEGDG